MRKLALRLLAFVALAGQLQWLPAATLCERHHQQASPHCAQHAQPSGRSVDAAPAPLADGCPLAGPCSPPASALPAHGQLVVATVASAGGDAGRSAAPPSFTSDPLSPPPQS